MDLAKRYEITPCDLRGVQGAIIDIVRFLEEDHAMPVNLRNHILAYINVTD